jgi:flavin reductase (DIM6/NTAB) family NADH-FMN oxidoreductase RutF
MSVNLLAENQQALAERFAAKRASEDADRFVHGDWTTRVTGAPLLAEALAALDCRVTNIIPLDTHAILIGEVVDIVFGPHAAPLIHFQAAYTSLLAGHREPTS